MRALLLCLLLVASAARAECLERALMDRIMNAAHDIPVALLDEAAADPWKVGLVSAHRAASAWAVAHAIGDYAGAAAMTESTVERLQTVLDGVREHPADDPFDQAYVELVIATTLARIALFDHDLLRAVSVGAEAYSRAVLLADARDTRARFHLGVYDYYTGRAPAAIRRMAGFDEDTGDRRRGIAILEETLSFNDPAAPEAARILLNELEEDERPACRYLPLALDLEAVYPVNQRFAYFADRERQRCAASGESIPDNAPRLGPSCAQ